MKKNQDDNDKKKEMVHIDVGVRGHSASTQ